MFIPVAIFTENDVDGDAFLLLEEESMRRMIKSEGLLLKFKKAYANLGLNTQKQIPKEPSKPLKPSPTLSEEWLKEHSKIYGRGDNNKTLNNWQTAVNKAAYELALENNTRVYDRADLRMKAESKAREGYVFQKRNGSWSKEVVGDDQQSRAKRVKLDSSQRARAMANFSDQLNSLKDQIAETQCHISRSKSCSDFEACSRAHTELRKLLVEKQKVESAMADVEAKDARARNYNRKKKKTPKDRSAETPSSYGTLDIRKLFSQKLPATTTSTTVTSATDTTVTSTSQEPQSSDSLLLQGQVEVEELDNLGTATEQADLIIQETNDPLEPQRADVTTDIGERSQTSNTGDENECSFLCECSPGKSTGT